MKPNKSCVVDRLCLQIAPVLMLLSIVCNAGELRTRWQLSPDGSSAELSLQWDEAVQIASKLSDHALMLSFDRAVGNLPIEQMNADLTRFVANIRYGFDTVLLELHATTRHTVDVGENGVVVRFTASAESARATPELDARLRELRAVALIETGDPCQARALLQAATATDRPDAQLYSKRGRAEQLCGDWLSALQSYDAAVAARPPSEAAFDMRHALLRERGSALSLNVWHRDVSGTETQDVAALTGQWLQRSFGWLRFDLESRDVAVDEYASGSGAIESFDGVRRYGSIEAIRADGTREWGAALLSNGKAQGLKAHLQSREHPMQIGFEATYRAPATEYVEGVINYATRDRALLRIGYQPLAGIVAGGWVAANGYDLDAHDDVARSMALGGELAMPLPLQLKGLRARYSLDAEYVSDPLSIDGPGGVAVEPLPLEDREVHALAIEASGVVEQDWDYNAALGYALDRFNDAGVFFSASVLFQGLDPLEIAASAASSMDWQRGSAERATQVGLKVKYGFY